MQIFIMSGEEKTERLDEIGILTGFSDHIGISEIENSEDGRKGGSFKR